jgi:excisionase family DNA binding protein
MGKGVSTLREVEPRLLRVKEAATYLSCTVWFIRSLAWNRAVPHVVFGKRILFDRADLDRYLESQKKVAA